MPHKNIDFALVMTAFLNASLLTSFGICSIMFGKNIYSFWTAILFGTPTFFYLYYQSFKNYVTIVRLQDMKYIALLKKEQLEKQEKENEEKS